MALPENIYVREKDKQEAKIRNLEQRCKALDNEVLVLRQRMAVIEDRFRPEPVKTDIIQCASNEVPENTEQISGTVDFVKKTRKPRKVAA